MRMKTSTQMTYRCHPQHTWTHSSCNAYQFNFSVKRMKNTKLDNFILFSRIKTVFVAAERNS